MSHYYELSYCCDPAGRSRICVSVGVDAACRMHVGWRWLTNGVRPVGSNSHGLAPGTEVKCPSSREVGDLLRKSLAENLGM